MLLREGVYPYEYIDSWQVFDEASLADKEAFYSNLNIKGIIDDEEVFYSSLNIKGIIDVDYRDTKKVLKVCNIKNLDEYHDLYV